MANEKSRKGLRIMPVSVAPNFAPSSKVTPEARLRCNGHKGGVLWFTGLSGSGKSTLAIELEKRLFARGYRAFVLDGDNLRHGLNNDLGFSKLERRENIRRVTEVAAILMEAGTLVICALISPFREDRERSRSVIGNEFHEIFVNASLEICETRDPKGLYKKARAGEINDFTGVSSRYEHPLNPAMTLDTGHVSIEACILQLVDYVDGSFGYS